SDALTEEGFCSLQEHARTLLTNAVDREQTAGGLSVSTTGRVKIATEYSLWFPDRGRFLFVKGSAREMFLLILHLLVIRGADQEIRRCHAPSWRTQNERGNLFLRVRKQQYCSLRCTKRANMRAWRMTPQDRGKARTSYERAVQKRTPGARPQRYRKKTATSVG